jgi:POT family proton-dependent oligopeptide transporter
MISGWEMPASWFQSFNPLMIFIFVPALNIFWGRQDRRGKEPSSIAKMGIGCIMLTAAFLVLIEPARELAVNQGQASGGLSPAPSRSRSGRSSFLPSAFPL